MPTKVPEVSLLSKYSWEWCHLAGLACSTMGMEKSSLLPVSVSALQSKDIDMSIVASGIDVGLATISVHCQTLDGFTVTLRGRQWDGVSQGSTSYTLPIISWTVLAPQQTYCPQISYEPKSVIHLPVS